MSWVTLLHQTGSSVYIASIPEPVGLQTYSWMHMSAQKTSSMQNLYFHRPFSSQLNAWQAAGVCLGQAIESKNGVNSVENAKANKETHFPIKHCNKPHNSKLRSFGQCSCRLVFLGPWTLMTLATNSADCSLSIQHLVSWIPCRYQGWLCRALKINLRLTGNTHHYCNQQICTRRTISIIN